MDDRERYDLGDEMVVVPKPGYGFIERRPCRGCTATIYWWRTIKGKRSPHDKDGTSHFATCPEAESFRQAKPERGSCAQ